MQKSYLLLRNNQELGPFTLTELLQRDLQPHDLVWVEHESISWSFPHEIEDLQPHLPFAKRLVKPAPATASSSETSSVNNTTSHKGIFVSMPSQARKEEPITPLPETAATDAIAESPAYTPQQNPSVSVPTYNRYGEEKVRDYLHLISVSNKHKKSSAFKKLIITVCLLGAIGFAAWRYIPWNKNFINNIFNRSHSITQKKELPQTNTAAVSNETSVNNETKPAATAMLNTPAVVVTDTTANKPAVVPQEQKQENAVAPVNPVKVDQTKSTDKHEAVVDTRKKQIAETTKEQKTQTTPAPPVANQTTPIHKEEKVEAEVEKSKPIATPPKEEKKSAPPREERRQAAQTTDEPKVQVLPTNSESPLAKQLVVKFSVPENAGGVKNATLTLTNKNAEAISKATIAILYHDDANIPIDKKIVYFGKLNSWQSVTVPLLDNARATSLSYRIVSVTGNY